MLEGNKNSYLHFIKKKLMDANDRVCLFNGT